MKKISAYHHPRSLSEQKADPSPGNYYVSVVDGPRFQVLAGPFALHSHALNMVHTAKTLAQEFDPRAVFYAFGTVKMKHSYKKPGILNSRLGL